MSFPACILALPLLTLSIASAAPADLPAWDAIDAAFGRPGKVAAGGVHRYGWPRSDLQVTANGVNVMPALALGTWASLFPATRGGEVMATGDLVLTPDELNPVVKALQAGGLEVTAIHNHLIGESPQVMYVHFSGHGDGLALAKTLRGALELTRTPLGAPAPAPSPTTAESAAFAAVEARLGRKGSLAGPVLQVAVPRRGKIEEDGMEVPAGAGMATALNIQAAGEKVAATGDFVITADEVNAVIRALQAHGIQVTALHSHMLRESPRLFFMHFWALDTPEAVAEGLKAALAKMDVQP